MSLPPDALARFEAIASEEGRDRSELFREMLRAYVARRELEEFTELQRHGAARAREVDALTADDVVRLVAEERGAWRA